MTDTMNTSLDEGLTIGCGCAACESAKNIDNTSTNNNHYNYWAGVDNTDQGPQYINTITEDNSRHNLLDSGYQWNTSTVYYNFITSTPGYYSGGDYESSGFVQFTDSMKTATREIMTEISKLINVNFVETTDINQTDMTFAQASLQDGAGAWAYYPTGGNKAGDVWTNTTYSSSNTNMTKGGYGYFVLWHEIGHALGLEHTFEAFNLGQNDNTIDNTEQYSVMAYNWSTWGSTYAESYMLYDIAVLQDMYGANTTHAAHSGNNTYTLRSGDAYAIWDGGGTDTLDGSAISSAMTLNLGEGQFSSVGQTDNITIAWNTTIENAEGGSAGDTIYGNDANNVINGNGGNDTFYGSLGNDTLNGGQGTDTVIYSYDISDFLITLSNSTTFLLAHIGDIFTDTISNFETFIFNGSSYDYDDMLDNLATIDDISMRFDWNLSGGVQTDSYTNSANGTSYLTGADIGVNSSSSNLVSLIRNNGTLVVNNLDISSHAVERFSYFDADAIDLQVNDFKEVLFNRTGSADFTLALDDIQRGTIYTGDSDDTITWSTHEWTAAASDKIAISAGNGTNNVTITGTYTGADVTIISGSGDDTLRVNIGADSTIRAGAGADIVTANAGDDKLFGEAGDDTLTGGAGADTLDGGDDNDTLYGNAGVDLLIGGDGNDILYGGSEGDTLRGDAGNDQLYGGDGNDEMIGGAGDDTLNGGNNNDRLYGDGYAGQNITGSDTIYGADGDDIIYGGQGADFLYGGAGNDFIRGDQISNSDTTFTGNDIITGDAGDDIIYGDAGDDNIDGGADNDKLYGGDGADTINGGLGTDHLDGGAGNDIMDGGDGDDRLIGRAGDDTLNGGAGVDRIFGDGGAGDATSGADTINGDAGDDWLYGGAGNDIINGGDDSDHLFGDNIGVGDDFSGDDTLNGGNGDDWLYGNDGNDILNGGAGIDYLYGDDGNDILNGGSGKDTLRGGNGNDTLNGEGGRDLLYGEGGADVFLFTADSAFNDMVFIRDFNAGEGDTINIENLLSNFTQGQDDINDFVAFTQAGGDSMLWVDADGNGGFTIVARISGNTGLDATTMINDGELIV